MNATEQKPTLFKILLVDDSRTILSLFKSLFEKSGYEVITAMDGEKALSLALEHKPDLLILDGHLPRLDGFEVCRRLRQNIQAQPVKILMLTGGNEADETQNAQNAGADLFLSKTIPPQEILEKAQHLLGKR